MQGGGPSTTNAKSYTSEPSKRTERRYTAGEKKPAERKVWEEKQCLIDIALVRWGLLKVGLGVSHW